MNIAIKTGLTLFLISFMLIINVHETNSVQVIQKQMDVAALLTKLSHDSDSLRQLRNQLAVIYAEMNNFDAAFKHFQLLLADDTTDVIVLNNLANLFFLKGQLDSADTLYQKAIRHAESKKESTGIYLNWGLLYAAADLEAEAVDMFSRVVQDSDDYQRIGGLLGIDLEQDDPTTMANLEARKKVDKATVIKLIDKARAKKKISKSQKRESKKTIGDKGTIPSEEIDNIFYWAHYGR